jgi:hypothetical protein
LILLLSLQDDSDVVFRATNGKWRAVLVEISRMNKVGRPVLVGTTSVEQSESLSEQLHEAGIPHEVFLLVSLTTINPFGFHSGMLFLVLSAHREFFFS